MTTHPACLPSVLREPVEFHVELRRLLEDHPGFAATYPALAQHVFGWTPSYGSPVDGATRRLPAMPGEPPLVPDQVLLELFSGRLQPFLVPMHLLVVLGYEDGVDEKPVGCQATSMNGTPKLLFKLITGNEVGDWLEYNSPTRISSLLKGLRNYLVEVVPRDVWGDELDTAQGFFADAPQRQHMIWTPLGRRAYQLVHQYLRAIHQLPFTRRPS